MTKEKNGWLSGYRKNAAEKAETLPLPQTAYTHPDIDLDKAATRRTPTTILHSEGREGIVFRDILEADLRKEHFNDETDKLAAMNTAYFEKGTYIHVPRNTTFSATRKLISSNSGFTRSIIILDGGAHLDFAEELASGEKSFFHSEHTQIYLGEGATLNFASAQDFGHQTAFTCTRTAVLGKNSRITWNLLSTGSGMTLCKRETLLEGEGSTVKDTELILANGNQHIDSTTSTSHIAPNTTGKISVKAILGDSSRQVSYGLVKIGPEARGTDSFLEEHSMLLTKNARADSIPALEILTNDVQAKHAATCAPLDEEKIFYMTTRGLDKHESKRLMVEGFASAAFLQMPESASALKARGKKWMQSLWQ
ncbi:SufD family Fe-S cluster assembly protein [Candidatus Woesearchaeota archaeon]|nr:SufD family Fe-S cluster assembly protein [Candidatus Woesearchaeota archaeon]